jgi:hypothetical protein
MFGLRRSAGAEPAPSDPSPIRADFTGATVSGTVGVGKGIDELEEALVSGKPDPATAGYVKGWFARNVPAIAGGVLSLVVHPVVGKLVEAGGNALADPFAQLVGGDE